MDNSMRLQTGMENLLANRQDLLKQGSMAIVTHSPSVLANGEPALAALGKKVKARLKAIFSPEHGFSGTGAAGAAQRSFRHPQLGIPVYSLYGRQRKPSPRMLQGIDVLLIDLQDLGFRCYTYLSTLALALEAAAETRTKVVMTDRPIPLPQVVDGPLLEPEMRSFVGLVDTPLCCGMTPGESARWIVARRRLELDLTVIPMQGYCRQAPQRGNGWPPWIPPSPAIASWESAMCYPATVMTEALPALDTDRHGLLPFQVLSSNFMDGFEVCKQLRKKRLRGLSVYPFLHVPAGAKKRRIGIRLVITNAATIRPVALAVHLLEVLQALYGTRRVWRNARQDWFDKLFGTPRVRERLLRGDSAADIIRSWPRDHRPFNTARETALLYGVHS